jgi:hypothetical protein
MRAWHSFRNRWASGSQATWASTVTYR